MRNAVLIAAVFCFTTLSWRHCSFVLAEDDSGDDDYQKSSELSGISIIPYPVPVTKTIVVPKPIIIQTTKTIRKPVYIPVPVGSLAYGPSSFGSYPTWGGASTGGYYYPGAGNSGQSGHSGGLYSTGGLPLSYGGHGYYPSYYPSFGAAGYYQYPKGSLSGQKGFSSAGWYHG